MRERILKFLDPNRSITLFIIGTAALTLVLQALYDWFNNPWVWQGGYGLAIVALVVAAAALAASFLRRPGRVTLREDQKPRRRKGLILLAGPTPGASPAAIRYHLPELQHCWVVASAASRHTALQLEQQFETLDVRIHQGTPFVVDAEQIQSTYDLLVDIIDREAPSCGITRRDLIADITGGLKPMTAGMTLACLARSCEMQYMKTLRDDQGQPIEGVEPQPIRIDAAFVPEQGA